MPDIQYWSDLYTRQQTPLFIPEHGFDDTAAAKAAFAIGHYEAVGVSPLSILGGAISIWRWLMLIQIRPKA